MNDELIVAGDFSGIQQYVLGISGAGKGQARRLRARSFQVQILGELVVRRLRAQFGGEDTTILVNGGGRFLIRIPAGPDSERRLESIRRDLEASLYGEFGGELALTLAWGRSVSAALSQEQREKRRPWATTMAGNRWNISFLSGPEIGTPCEMCQRRHATKEFEDDDERVRVCRRCEADLNLGRRLARVQSVDVGEDRPDFRLLGMGVSLRDQRPDSTTAYLRRHVPLENGQIVPFDEIAALSTGDNRLGVLKADVDGMGKKVADLIAADPSYAMLRQVSTKLERFFSEELQELLEANSGFRHIYSVYSGGDDLLLIGPWNVTVEFACEMHNQFRMRFGGRENYGLTISAGIALTSHNLPVRYAAERSNDLLELAKQGDKNQCATLGTVCAWKDLCKIVKRGRRIQRAIEAGFCSRAVIHRLYSLASGESSDKTGLWAHQIGRNFPDRNHRDFEAREMREWGESILDTLEPRRAPNLAAGLLYGLLASRRRRED